MLTYCIGATSYLPYFRTFTVTWLLCMFSGPKKKKGKLETAKPAKQVTFRRLKRFLDLFMCVTETST